MITFVVAKEFAHTVVGVHSLDDGATNPHHPARLVIKGDGRRYAVRKLSRPAKVEALLPCGPPCKPPSYAAVMGAGKDAASLNEAMRKWYRPGAQRVG